MKSDMVSDDTRALRLVHKLRRRVKKKAAQLRAQRPADPAQSDREERARLAIKAVNRRLRNAIATLEKQADCIRRNSLNSYRGTISSAHEKISRGGLPWL